MAIEKNLDLQIAAADIEEFQAPLMIAKSDLVWYVALCQELDVASR